MAQADVLNGDPAPPSPKGGGGAEPPNFRPMFIVVIYDMLLSCYLVYTARRPTRSCTQPCRVQGSVDGLLRTQPCTCTQPIKHGRVYGPYTAVYTIVYTTVQMAEYTAMYGRCNGHETSGHAVTV